MSDDERAAAEALLALYAAVDGEACCWQRVVKLLIGQQDALARRDAAAVLEVCRLLRTAGEEMALKQRRRCDAVAAYARLTGMPSEEVSLAGLANAAQKGNGLPDAERWRELRRRLARVVRAAQIRSSVNEGLVQEQKGLDEAIISALMGVPEVPRVEASGGAQTPSPALLNSSA